MPKQIVETRQQTDPQTGETITVLHQVNVWQPLNRTGPMYSKTGQNRQCDWRKLNSVKQHECAGQDNVCDVCRLPYRPKRSGKKKGRLTRPGR